MSATDSLPRSGNSRVPGGRGRSDSVPRTRGKRWAGTTSANTAVRPGTCRRATVENRVAGTTLAETTVGLLVGCLVLLAALALARGFVRLGTRVAREAGDLLGAEAALARVVTAVARAGAGVPAEGPDEPVELLEPWAIAVRGDRDGDLPGRALDPERWLSPAGDAVPVANDEVVVFLRRNAGGGGRRRARFVADLDSPDRVRLPDGTVLARRDGVGDAIDAGPAAGEDDRSPGTFYRVTFVHDARRAGTGRFRVVEPLADRVTGFRVLARDRAGREVPPCGGGDSPAARACRARVARVRIELLVADGRGGSVALVREVAAGSPPGWRP